MNSINPTSVIETITPEIAKQWLDDASKQSLSNRNVSKAVVSSYVDTMKNGNWMVNGEPIAFDVKGQLVNGFHRLTAVVESGCSIQSFIVRGIETKAFATFDCGRSRTFGQLLFMNGAKSGNITAAIIKQYLALRNSVPIDDRGSYDVRTKLHETNKTLVDTYLRNKSFFSTVTENTIKICGSARVLNHSFVGASIAYLIKNSSFNEEFIYRFFEMLCGVDTAPVNNVNVLRKKLFNERNSKKDKFTAQVNAYLTIKCWNDYVNHVDKKLYKWNKEVEGFPKYQLNFSE